MRPAYACRMNSESGSDGRSTIALQGYSLQQLDSYLPSGTNISGLLSANTELGWGDGGPNDRRAVVDISIDQLNVRTVDLLGDSVNFGYETLTLKCQALAPDTVTASLTAASTTLGASRA